MTLSILKPSSKIDEAVFDSSQEEGQVLGFIPQEGMVCRVSSIFWGFFCVVLFEFPPLLPVKN